MEKLGDIEKQIHENISKERKNGKGPSSEDVILITKDLWDETF